jgi:hypothetical protein
VKLIKRIMIALASMATVFTLVAVPSVPSMAATTTPAHVTRTTQKASPDYCYWRETLFFGWQWICL